MLTDLSFNAAARKKMQKGVDQLADAVKVTLGPRGRNVAIRNDDPKHTITITKDGVTVANTINLPDKVEDMGAQLVKMAAQKTAILAGDGTTTSTLLAQVIIREGIAAVDAGTNPMDIKRGMDKAVEVVLGNLTFQKKDVTDENLIQIATIAANNDTAIGTLVADAITKTGKDGVIYMDESRTGETYLTFTEGIQIDRGYISPKFVNVPQKMTVEFDNALILFSERKITFLQDIQHLLEIAIASKRPLLIIAEDVDGDALATLIKNKLEGGVKFAAIKQPGFGNMQIQMMEDIALMTGGKLVTQSDGQAWEKVDEKFFGKADKVIITSTSTSIIGPKGKKAAIDKRVEEIKALIENTKNEFEADKIRKMRLARITNSTGIIHVYGQTDVEMKEKRDRIEDSICATKSAVAEGVLPGGGVAYIRAIASLPQSFPNTGENEGLRIIKVALESPLRQMLQNAGEGQIDSVINRVAESEELDYGYNVKTGEFEHMFAAGIIDPAKVSRVALENATSVGAMFLTTECAIVDIQPTK